MWSVTLSGRREDETPMGFHGDLQHKMVAFVSLANNFFQDRSTVLKVNLGSHENGGATNEPENERIIQELKRKLKKKRRIASVNLRLKSLLEKN